MNNPTRKTPLVLYPNKTPNHVVTPEQARAEVAKYLTNPARRDWLATMIQEKRNEAA